MSSTPNRPVAMAAARFHAGGQVAVDAVPVPGCPPGGLLVRTLACGLCSGELMGWYMERKARSGPHVLGHEAVGIVVESEDNRFPIGTQVSPHHHAPCLDCGYCRRGAFVHCDTWKRTRLDPGGMAEFFAVPAENLADCLATTGLDTLTATLVEPLACVSKQLRRVRYQPGEPACVIGLGAMGLLHALLMPGCTAIEPNPNRAEWAKKQGVDVRQPEECGGSLCTILCPGSAEALGLALRVTGPAGRIGLFAPLPPGPQPFDFETAYMKDIELINSYSCGPEDTRQALEWLQSGKVTGSQVYTTEVSIAELPGAYDAMRKGEVLKAVVRF